MSCYINDFRTINSIINCVTSTHIPSVKVPVLSKARKVTCAKASKKVPPLIKVPRRAAPLMPQITTMGVAMRSEQGHAVTNTISALSPQTLMRPSYASTPERPSTKGKRKINAETTTTIGV